jgi:hypothetical protein
MASVGLQQTHLLAPSVLPLLKKSPIAVRLQPTEREDVIQKLGFSPMDARL